MSEVELGDVVDSSSLKTKVKQLGAEGASYFDNVDRALEHFPRDTHWHTPVQRDQFWKELPLEWRNCAVSLVDRLLPLLGGVASAVKGAPLASDADLQDVMTAVKSMRAALLLRKFQSWDTEVLHDEGLVLGVTQAGQTDKAPCTPEDARRIFLEWGEKVESILDLVLASGRLDTRSDVGASASSVRYRPDTAFIIMTMNPSMPELTDVADTIKQVFLSFGVNAVRADDIEHQGLITDQIRNQIRTAEFCFADLTHERPNVYYEVGYAHALGRRVILFKKAGAALHFDLSGYNCPDYRNNHELREKLTKRLEQLTNRKPHASGST